MKFGRTFFRIMGICAFVAAALDVVSWILSRFITYPTNFSEHLAILSNPNYPAQIYVIIFSLLFALPVYWGIAAKKMDTRASIVLVAFIFISIWWLLDTLNHSLRLFFVHNDLVVGYANATSTIAKDNIGFLYEHMDGIFKSLAFARIPLSLAGTFLFFLATWRSKGLEKIASVFLLISFLHGILYVMIYNFGLTWIFPIIDPFYEFVSVPEFIAIGAWLFFADTKSH
jgi:hypothetical protein